MGLSLLGSPIFNISPSLSPGLLLIGQSQSCSSVSALIQLQESKAKVTARIFNSKKQNPTKYFSDKLLKAIQIQFSIPQQKEQAMRTAKFPKQLTIALSQEVYDAARDESNVKMVSMAEVLREYLDHLVSRKSEN